MRIKKYGQRQLVLAPAQVVTAPVFKAVVSTKRRRLPQEEIARIRDRLRARVDLDI